MHHEVLGHVVFSTEILHPLNEEENTLHLEVSSTFESVLRVTAAFDVLVDAVVGHFADC